MFKENSLSRSKFAFGDVLSALAAGLAIGMLAIFLEVSLAAMIFSGELSGFVANGIGILLFGTVMRFGRISSPRNYRKPDQTLNQH
jgi:hypothetical protein